MVDLQKKRYNKKKRKRKKKRLFSRLCKCILVWGLICVFAYIACETEETSVVRVEQLRNTVDSCTIEEELAELLEKMTLTVKVTAKSYGSIMNFVGR